MNADDDFQADGELFLQPLVQNCDIPQYGRGRLHGVAAGMLRVLAKSEKRHGAIADEFVEMASRLFDSLADDGEIAVQKEDDIIGQLRFGKRGEVA